MRQWCLVNLARHEVAKDRRGRFVLKEASHHPRELPAGFASRDGWVYEEVCGETVDRNHTGKPIYKMLDPQVARVTKIISPPKA